MRKPAHNRSCRLHSFLVVSVRADREGAGKLRIQLSCEDLTMNKAVLVDLSCVCVTQPLLAEPPNIYADDGSYPPGTLGSSLNPESIHNSAYNAAGLVLTRSTMRWGCTAVLTARIRRTISSTVTASRRSSVWRRSARRGVRDGRFRMIRNGCHTSESQSLIAAGIQRG